MMLLIGKTQRNSFICADCKEEFERGSQGDNEKYCLRCDDIYFMDCEFEMELEK